MERCAHLLITQPDALRGRWLDGSPFKELHLELGCGKGRFIVELAKAEVEKVSPGVFFAALEKTANVMVIALERAAQDGLDNVRFINDFVDDLAEYFAPSEVSRIYINFCDPWPASRHKKRRLTDQRFLELYRQVLCPGGEIHFKTDNLPLFDFSLNAFELCGFDLLEITRNLHKDDPAGVMSDYERKFHEQGLPIYRCVVKNNNMEMG
jgi:tRNA (guanine-N7-)-methyltransferase